MASRMSKQPRPGCRSWLRADAAGQLIGAAAQPIAALIGGKIAKVRAAQHPLSVEAEILIAVGVVSGLV